MDPYNTAPAVFLFPEIDDLPYVPDDFQLDDFDSKTSSLPSCIIMFRRVASPLFPLSLYDVAAANSVTN